MSTEQVQRSASHLAARISIIYAVIAGTWIFASDALIASLSTYIKDPSNLQTYKGWLFVAVTALLLYGTVVTTVRSLPRQWASTKAEDTADARPDAADPKARRVLWTQQLIIPLLIFLGLALAIGLTGWLTYAHEREALKRDKRSEITAVADTKVASIVRWLEERRAHAKLIATDPFLAAGIRQWLTDPSGDARLAELLGWLGTLQRSLGYRTIAVVDGEGHTLLDTIPVMIGAEARTRIKEAVTTRDVVVSDLFRTENPDGGSSVVLDIVAPILISDPALKPAADALMLRVDAEQYLFPLVESWPTPSASAETELVRREGDEVVYLNAVRHAPHRPMSVRRRINEPDLPPARALRGEVGIQEGIDYRGVPVLAVAKHIPGTEWIMVAEIDANEVYGSLRRIALATSVVVAICIICAGTGIALWWMQQRAKLLAEHFRTRLERQALVRHFDYLSKYANDIILLTDEHGHIVEANARAEQVYGYDREDLLGRPLATFCDAGIHANTERRTTQLATGDGVVFEAQHRRRNGRLFPVEVSTRTIEVQGRQFQHSIVRDISDRVEAEQRARELNEQLRRVGIANELGQMISSLAHELRQPLTAAMNYVNTTRRLLKMDPPSTEKALAMTVKAGEQIGRADHFVHDVRAFVQYQACDFAAEDIRGLIEETMQFALIGVAHLGILVSCRYEQRVPPVRVDKIRIQQVLLNLIRNAAEAMSQSPRRELTIETRLASPSDVEVGVADNGCGIAPELTSRLFEAFVTTKPGGMGIGLSVCRGIVEAHGGRLWAEPAPGGGTAFRFTLPVADAGEVTKPDAL